LSRPAPAGRSTEIIQHLDALISFVHDLICHTSLPVLVKPTRSSMSKATKAKSSKPLSFDQASRRLPQVQSKREALLGTYQQAHAAYHAAHDQLATSFKALSRA